MGIYCNLGRIWDVSLKDTDPIVLVPRDLVQKGPLHSLLECHGHYQELKFASVQESKKLKHQLSPTRSRHSISSVWKTYVGLKWCIGLVLERL